MPQSDNITYRELVDFYGQDAAYVLLRTIEAAIHERSNVIYLDKERRLQEALNAMSEKLLAA